MATFPHDTEPDGRVQAPHHYYTGLLITHAAAVATDAGTLSFVALGGCVAFFTMWRKRWYAPWFGATVSLLALAASAVLSARLAFGGEYLYSVVAMVGVLVAADDGLEHAFGVWMPLDALWKNVLGPAIAR